MDTYVYLAQFYLGSHEYAVCQGLAIQFHHMAAGYLGQGDSDWARWHNEPESPAWMDNYNAWSGTCAHHQATWKPDEATWDDSQQWPYTTSRRPRPPKRCVIVQDHVIEDNSETWAKVAINGDIALGLIAGTFGKPRQHRPSATLIVQVRSAGRSDGPLGSSTPLTPMRPWSAWSLSRPPRTTTLVIPSRYSWTQCMTGVQSGARKPS